MDNYELYVGLALATILLPGPAVMLTINNAVQRSLSYTFAGILGVALAILLVATVSATSLGVLLVSSAMAFTAVKLLGAVYLVYLGIKMWRKKASSVPDDAVITAEWMASKACPDSTKQRRTIIRAHSCWSGFAEGFLVSFTNPKALVFFMSIFPQFIDVSKDYTAQFSLLAGTFSGLVILVHSGYALACRFAKAKLPTNGGGLLNKISGGVFIGFGLGLAASSK